MDILTNVMSYHDLKIFKQIRTSAFTTASLGCIFFTRNMNIPADTKVCCPCHRECLMHLKIGMGLST